MDRPAHRSVGWSILWNLAVAQLRQGRSVVLDGLARGRRGRRHPPDGRRHRRPLRRRRHELPRRRRPPGAGRGPARGIPGWHELDWDHVSGSSPGGSRRRATSASTPSDPLADNVAALEASLRRLNQMTEAGASPWHPVPGRGTLGAHGPGVRRPSRRRSAARPPARRPADAGDDGARAGAPAPPATTSSCSGCPGAACRWRPRWRPPSAPRSTSWSWARSACPGTRSWRWPRWPTTAPWWSTPGHRRHRADGPRGRRPGPAARRGPGPPGRGAAARRRARRPRRPDRGRGRRRHGHRRHDAGRGRGRPPAGPAPGRRRRSRGRRSTPPASCAPPADRVVCVLTPP